MTVSQLTAIQYLQMNAHLLSNEEVAYLNLLAESDIKDKLPDARRLQEMHNKVQIRRRLGL